MDGTDVPTAEPDSGAASAAGLYAALLGSQHVAAADKASAERLLRAAPELGHLALLNWEWLHRAVRYLIMHGGIRQIIDLGSGILTPPLMHEAHPDIRVVYVDKDPYAARTSQAIVRDTDNAVYLQADAGDPGAVLGHPETRALLDFTQPIGIVMGSLIHFIPEDDAARVARTYLDRIPSGSYLALTCAVRDLVPVELLKELRRSIMLYKTQTMARPDMRKHAAVETYFAGLDLVPPGIVPVGRWHSDGRSLVARDSIAHRLMVAAVARKP